LTQGTHAKNFPLAPARAQQAFNYAKNNTLFLHDLIEAMKKLSNVPNEFTNAPLLEYYPEIRCIKNVKKCVGDVFMTNCGIVDPAC